MTWPVQYREGAADIIERHRSPGEAIVAASRLLDRGQDVYDIGTDAIAGLLGIDEIARIYTFQTPSLPGRLGMEE